jgi:hypothetical protein
MFVGSNTFYPRFWIANPRHFTQHRIMQSTKMKIFCAVLLSFVLIKVASSFTAGPCTHVLSRNRRQTAVTLKETAAEAYLTQCLDEWDLLEKELVNLKAHAKVSKDENVSYEHCVSILLFFGELVIDHHNTASQHSQQNH